MIGQTFYLSATIRQMTRARTYADQCGVARALDIVGERWALLIVRELLLGPKRFTDLRAGLPKIGPDILSQRLRELELAAVVSRHQLPAPAASWVYELTDRGRELEPVVLALGRWGSRTAAVESGAFGADSAVLALKTLFSPAAADDLDATYSLRFGEQRFTIRISNASFEVYRGDGGPEPDAIIETIPGALASLLWHGGSLNQMEREGDLKIQGSRPSVMRFITAFPIAA
jgi:DNA-binding HxlR family transcriptional regulator